MSSSSRNDKKNHHHDHQNKARSPSPSPFSPSFSYSFSLCLSVSVFALQSLTSASSFLHSGAVSFSVSSNTLNFEKLLLDFKISLEKLLKKERARLRERERDDDDDSDDDFILLLFVVLKVAPLLFYVFVFKVVLIFEKKYYE